MSSINIPGPQPEPEDPVTGLARRFPKQRDRIRRLESEGLAPEQIEQRLALHALRALQQSTGRRQFTESEVASALGTDEAGLQDLLSVVRQPQEVQQQALAEGAQEAFTVDPTTPAGGVQAPTGGPVGEAALQASQAAESGLAGVLAASPVGGVLEGLTALQDIMTGRAGEGGQFGQVQDDFAGALRILSGGTARNLPAARAGDTAQAEGTGEALLQGIAPSVLAEEQREQLPEVLQALERVGGGIGQSLPFMAVGPGGASTGAGQSALRAGGRAALRGAAAEGAVETGLQGLDALLGEAANLGSGRDITDPQRALEIITASGAGGLFAGGGSLIQQPFQNARLNRQLLAAQEAELRAQGDTPEINAQVERIRAAKQRTDELVDRPMETPEPPEQAPVGGFQGSERFRQIQEMAQELETVQEPTAREVVEATEVAQAREAAGMRPDGPEPTTRPRAGDRASQQQAASEIAGRLDGDPEVTRPPTPTERANGVKDVLEVEPVTADAELPEPIRRSWWKADKLRQNIVPNLRQTQDFMADRRALVGRIANFRRTANDTGKQLVKQLDANQRQIMDDVLRGRRDPAELPEAARPLVQRLDTQIREQSRELQRLGIISPEQQQAIEAAEGAYLRRSYRAFLEGKDWSPPSETIRKAKRFLMAQGHDAEDAGKVLSDLREGRSASLRLPGEKQPVSVDASSLKQRTLPKPLREYLGEVDDGVFNAVETLTNTARMAEEAKYFRKVHEDLDLHKSASPDQLESLSARLSPVSEEQKAILGPLYDADVPKWMADDIVGRFKLEQVQRDLMDQGIGLFKFNKVLGRPGAYFRNFMTNTFFGFQAGFYPQDWVRWIPRASREIFKRGPEYQDALKRGSIGTEFFGIERNQFLESLVTRMDGVKGPRDLVRVMVSRIRDFQGGLGEVYDFMDQVWKLALDMKARHEGVNTGRVIDYFGGPGGRARLQRPVIGGEKGDPLLSGIVSRNKRRKLSGREATAHVNTYMPNYEEVAPLFQMIRGRQGSSVGRKIGPMAFNPFIVFPVETTRVHANAARFKPWTAAAGMAATAATHRYSWYIAGGALALSEMERQRRDALRENQPNYFRFPSRLEVQLPVVDDEGNHQAVDLSYIHPMGDMLSGYEADPSKTTAENAPQILRSALAEQFMGGILNQEVFDPPRPTQPFSEQAFEWAQSKFLPSIVPGGSDFEAFQEIGTQTSFGEPRTATQAVARQFGLNLRSVDPEASQVRRAVELNSLVRDLEKRKFDLQKLFVEGKQDKAQKEMRNLLKQMHRVRRHVDENQIQPAQRIRSIEEQIENGELSASERNGLLEEKSTLETLMDILTQGPGGEQPEQ